MVMEKETAGTLQKGWGPELRPLGVWCHAGHTAASHRERQLYQAVGRAGAGRNTPPAEASMGAPSPWGPPSDQGQLELPGRGKGPAKGSWSYLARVRGRPGETRIRRVCPRHPSLRMSALFLFLSHILTGTVASGCSPHLFGGGAGPVRPLWPHGEGSAQALPPPAPSLPYPWAQPDHLLTTPTPSPPKVTRSVNARSLVPSALGGLARLSPSWALGKRKQAKPQGRVRCDPRDCSPPGSSIHVKNIGVGCHSLLQGIFLTQGSNLDLRIRGRYFTIGDVPGHPDAVSKVLKPHPIPRNASFLWVPGHATRRCR